MSFFTNESMLDTEQLREILGEDVIHQLKNQKRQYGEFPSHKPTWGYGIGATLINWNYDVTRGEAVEYNQALTSRCRHTTVYIS